MAERVGVRELRQNLSRYLERVKAGESLMVTEHGREVARLVPSGAEPVYAELAERFGATVPTEPLEAIIDRIAAGADAGAPAGTTDAWLADARRDALD
jgi:prevent-host-death family protein